jgi:hypothetical protein
MDAYKEGVQSEFVLNTVCTWRAGTGLNVRRQMSLQLIADFFVNLYKYYNTY